MFIFSSNSTGEKTIMENEEQSWKEGSNNTVTAGGRDRADVMTSDRGESKKKIISVHGVYNNFNTIDSSNGQQ
jgi:hypothetical protein